MVKQLHFYLITAVVMTVTHSILAQNSEKVYKTDHGYISFFSETPIENIDAKSYSMISAINPNTKNITAVMMINSFKFKNSLMESHFNERYMESEKYPKLWFSGVINENIDLTKPGIYMVTVTGKLTIHGVEQTRTIRGTITVDKLLKLSLNSEFDVKLVDHNIEVPKLVFHKIGEVINVKINSDYKMIN
jgi:hypothetical protein